MVDSKKKTNKLNNNTNKKHIVGVIVHNAGNTTPGEEEALREVYHYKCKEERT